MVHKMFYKTLQENNLFDPNKKVLLAVSGGVDSIVLLNFMQNLPLSKRPQLSIAHVNHQLRAASAEEEQFIKKIANQHQIPIYIHQWAKEKHPAAGIEEAARIERYAFFKEIMNQHEMEYLMTGHHLDDQIETVLMRLTRGASLEQLLGIRPVQKISLNHRAGYLIRPLLHLSKEEIYAQAEQKGLAFVEDATNQETDFTRNRFRHEILPLLKAENERFNEHIQQFTTDLSDLLEISTEPIQKAYHELVYVKDNNIHLQLKQFTKYSQAMQRAVLTAIFENLYQGKSERYKTNYIDLVCQWLLEGEVNTSLDLIGSFTVKKCYTKAVFMKKQQKTHEKSLTELAEFKIDQLNQWIKLSETETIGLFVKEQPIDSEPRKTEELLIPEEHLHLPLRIRHRQAGDRMSYKGLNGSKKISDIFIDDKTPPAAREKAWVIEDNQGTILWLVGHRKMDLFTEKETDKLVYGLRYTKKIKEYTIRST